MGGVCVSNTVRARNASACGLELLLFQPNVLTWASVLWGLSELLLFSERVFYSFPFFVPGFRSVTSWDQALCPAT